MNALLFLVVFSTELFFLAVVIWIERALLADWKMKQRTDRSYTSNGISMAYHQTSTHLSYSTDSSWYVSRWSFLLFSGVFQDIT
ncbi:MAG: hypothetical protein K9W43_04835 [Candidatus Thorarchaeota archaeon]|nr:hypothetical protein [Candidatus Thorarchaeota archaeon]